MPYIVKCKRRSTGALVLSQVYDTKQQALAHVANTKRHWKHMYSNPRVKKI